jgi:hypothetical protein
MRPHISLVRLSKLMVDWRCNLGEGSQENLLWLDRQHGTMDIRRSKASLCRLEHEFRDAAVILSPVNPGQGRCEPQAGREVEGNGFAKRAARHEAERSTA